VTFEQWMAAVDREIARRAGGFTSSDLADWQYRDNYDQGASPIDVALDVLEDNGMEDFNA
jgi:Family of unknown function (DUF5419)